MKRKNRAPAFSGFLSIAMTLVLGAGVTQADVVGIGRSEGGGLGVSVGVGGISADVSVGGSRSVASVDADVGGAVDATATVGGGSVANAEVNVGSGVNVGTKVGGDTVATVSVGVGTTSADVCVGGCGTPGVPGVPGTNPPGVTPPTNPPTNPPTGPVAGVPGVPKPGTTPPKVPKILACASADGNTTAFNGYPLMDRDGRVLGVIHSAELDGNAAIRTVSIRDAGKGCTTLRNGGFKVAGYSIKGAFDAAKMGMAYQ